MPKSKKEINKEKMFSKIMPTGVGARPVVAPNVKAAKPFNPDAELEKQTAEQIKEIEKQAEEAPKTEEEKQVDEYVEKLNAKKQSSPAESVDTLIEAEKSKAKVEKKVNQISTVMVNIRERMVMNKLDEALEKFNCCKCYFCRQDVTTIALNSLQPKYVVTLEEDIDKIIECEDYEDVTQAIMKAILQVKTHPRH